MATNAEIPQHGDPMLERVNPLLIKKAAELAEPDFAWCVEKGQVKGMHLGDMKFNPLESDADAMKLERALKGNKWFFGKSYFSRDKRYWAVNNELGFKDFDESDTLLLLKCISAMFSIPLYLETK